MIHIKRGYTRIAIGPSAVMDSKGNFYWMAGWIISLLCTVMGAASSFHTHHHQEIYFIAFSMHCYGLWQFITTKIYALKLRNQLNT